MGPFVECLASLTLTRRDSCRIITRFLEFRNVPGCPVKLLLGEEQWETGGPGAQLFDVAAPADLEVIEGFWFAWIAFHPDSDVFTAPPSKEDAKTKRK